MKAGSITQAKMALQKDELMEEFGRVFEDIRKGRIHKWEPRFKQ